MRCNQIKAGAIISYFQIGLNILISLIYQPVMIRLLGQSEYGLYNVAKSTISMLGVLSLGLGSGYIKFYAKYKKEGNADSIYKLNGLFIIIFSILGFIALICGMLINFNLELFFADGLTTEEYKIAGVLTFILTINLAISFPMSVFSNIISAHERFVFLKIVEIIKTVLTPIAVVIFLYMGYKSIALVMVTFVLSIIAEVVYFIYVILVLKVKFRFRNMPKGVFRGLFVFTSFIAINLIVDQINLNLDKFLLGRFGGTSAVAVYSVGYVLYSYFMTFSTAISSVFTPRVHNMVCETENDDNLRREKLTNLFVSVGRVQFIVLALLASGVALFGRQFILLYWAGEGYEDSYLVAIILILSSITPLIQNIGIEIQRAENKHKFRSIVYIIMAVVNLVLSIFLCQIYGAAGAAVGTAVSFILANGIIMNIYYHKHCFIDIKKFWLNILRLSLGLILPIAVGIGLLFILDASNIWHLGIGIVAYTVMYMLSMWFIGMNQNEKSWIKNLLRKEKYNG